MNRRRGWQRGWTRATNQRGYRWWWIVRQSRRPAAGVDAGDSSGSCGQSEGIVAMATGACVHRLAYRHVPYTQTYRRTLRAHASAPFTYLNISRARVFVHLWNAQISNTYGRTDVCARISECTYICIGCHLSVPYVNEIACIPGARAQLCACVRVFQEIGVNAIYLCLFITIPLPFCFSGSPLFAHPRPPPAPLSLSLCSRIAKGVVESP